jgi:hypothetical protein
MSTSSVIDQYNRMYIEAQRGMRCSDFVSELVTHITKNERYGSHTLEHSFPIHNEIYDKSCQQMLVQILKPVLETKEFKIIYGTTNRGVATVKNRKLTIE